MTTTTSAPTDIDELLLHYQESLKTVQDKTSASTYDADLQKRISEAYKKLNADLAKATDLQAKQDAGEVALSGGSQAYVALRNSLERKGFDDRILLNGSIVVVDSQIEQLRQKWLDAQGPKTDAEAMLKIRKIAEDRALALLDAAKAKLVGLPKSIQDRIGEIDTKRQAVSTALEKDDLVGAGIALTELKEALDAGKSQVDPDKTKPLEGAGSEHDVDDIYKKKPPVDYAFPLPSGYMSLEWQIDAAYEQSLIDAIEAALQVYLGTIRETAEATRDFQEKAQVVADYEKRYKDAQTNRLTNIKSRYSKALADAAAAAEAEAEAEAAAAATGGSYPPSTVAQSAAQTGSTAPAAAVHPASSSGRRGGKA